MCVTSIVGGEEEELGTRVPGDFFLFLFPLFFTLEKDGIPEKNKRKTKEKKEKKRKEKRIEWKSTVSSVMIVNKKSVESQ